MLRRLVIEKAKLTFRNSTMKEPIEAEFAHLEALGGGMDDPVKLTMKGSYQKSPFDLTADLGTFRELREGGKPYPVKAKIDAGTTSVSYPRHDHQAARFPGLRRHPLAQGQEPRRAA